MDLFFFLDFETTGLIEPGKPDPLVVEVGWSITTASFYPPRDTCERFVWDDRYGSDPRKVWEVADPFALEMHAKSGLYAEWWEWATARRAKDRWGNVAEVDAAMSADVQASKAMYRPGKVIVAGSGVGPFDVPVLRKYFPATSALVHYRPLDVSSIREMGKVLDPPVVSPWPDTDRPHRAAGDVDWSVREARWWREWMGLGVNRRAA